MINKKATLIVVAALVTALMLSSFALTNSARSQTDTEPTSVTSIFLKIDNIQGGSVEQNHTGWIDIASFNWSEAMAYVNARAAGKLSMQDFSFMAETSIASPQLFQAAATGKYFSSTTLECCLYGESPVLFLKFQFQGVTITSYSIAGNTSALPLDQFSIAFQKITMTYVPIGPEGEQGAPVTASYP